MFLIIFHVIKLFNDQLSEFRRDLYHEAKDILQKKILKGTRWLLLKNPENLIPSKGKDRLEEALQLNKPLSCAYYLKEDLRQIWLQNQGQSRARINGLDQKISIFRHQDADEVCQNPYLLHIAQESSLITITEFLRAR